MEEHILMEISFKRAASEKADRSIENYCNFKVNYLVL
jgi:hypothetical protein